MLNIKRTGWAAVSVLLAACGGSTWVQIPPSIDLTRHEILGVIEFTSSNEGELAAYTTRTFIEQMRADQGLIRIVELGREADVLAAIGAAQLDRDALQAIGEEHGLTTVVTGRLDVSSVRPAVRISPNLSNISAGADVDAKLAVRMVEASSGASIWGRSAEATKRVGQVSVLGGRFAFDADDPERAYGELVRALVEATTGDFKVTWERRRR